MNEVGVAFLAFEVSTHHGGIYRAVRYTGEEIRSWGIGMPFTVDQQASREQAERRRFTLGA